MSMRFCCVIFERHSNIRVLVRHQTGRNTGHSHFNIHLSVLGIAPASKLRPILLHLCQRQTFEAIAPGMLELLPNSPQYIEPISVMAPWSGEVNDEIRLAFRRSLAVDLYGWDAFDSLRLRLAVADYCWVSYKLLYLLAIFGSMIYFAKNPIRKCPRPRKCESISAGLHKGY